MKYTILFLLILSANAVRSQSFSISEVMPSNTNYSLQDNIVFTNNTYPITIDGLTYLRFYSNDERKYYLYSFDGEVYKQIPTPLNYNIDVKGNYVFKLEGEIYITNHIRNANSDELYRVEGGLLNKVQLPDNLNFIGYPIVYKNAVFFVGFDENDTDKTLFKFDGTTFESVSIPNNQRFLGKATVFDDRLIFYTRNENGYYLSEYDGNEVRNIVSTGEYDIAQFVYNDEGKLYFKFTTLESGNFINSLGVYDGQVVDSIPLPAELLEQVNSNLIGIISYPISFQGNLFFKSRLGNTQYVLVEFDGNNYFIHEIPQNISTKENDGYNGNPLVIDDKLMLIYYYSIGGYRVIEFSNEEFTIHPEQLNRPFHFYFNQRYYFSSVSDLKNKLYHYDFIPCKTESEINIQTCDSYILPSGKEIFESGVYMDTLALENCDSIIKINLDISSSSSLDTTIKACDSYLSPSKKYLWEKSGTYSDTILNSTECDSLIKIHLDLEHTTYIENKISDCNSYKSLNGDIYSTSGEYEDTIGFYRHCPMILQTQLEIRQQDISTKSTYSLTKGDTIFLGDEKITETGVYKVTYTSKSGCDSVVTYDLIFNSSICQDTTFIAVHDTLVINQTITNEFSDELTFNLKVYPNPTSEYLYLERNSTSNRDVYYQLYTINDQVLTAGKLEQEITVIEFNSIDRSGLYFLKIYDDSRQINVIKKIVFE